MKYKIGDKVKTNGNYVITIHSIVEKDGKVFYDGVEEKDIIGLTIELGKK